MPNKANLLARTTLVVCFAFLGLSAGMTLGGRFVPVGSGLAGPVIAVAYGFAGLLLATIVGALLSSRLQPAAFNRTLLVSAVLAALILAWVAYQIVRARIGSPAGS